MPTHVATSDSTRTSSAIDPTIDLPIDLPTVLTIGLPTATSVLSQAI